MGKTRQLLAAPLICLIGLLIAVACLLTPQSAYAVDSRGQGTVGLMDYIIQGDFTEGQKSDAQAAKDWLTGDADKAYWYDLYVDLGEEDDATSLANLKNALTYMDAVNAIRAENGLNELKISLFAMAGAELNCSYSGENGTLAHAGTYNNPAGMGGYAVENLAQAPRDLLFSGSSDPDAWWDDYASGNLYGNSWPFIGWYTQEKFMFDSGTQEYSLVGHYLNFVAPELRSFGIAVGDGVTIWKGTNYGGSFTVDEFKALVDDYIASVFSDVNSSTAHADDIWWMLDTGISTGFNDGTFRGLDSVARQDMAAFLHRLATFTGTDLPQSDISYFPDVTPETSHYEDILWLSSTGITEGFPDGTFRGMQAVARQDMAAFLYRLAGSPDYEPSEEAALKFADVDESTPHYKEILWLAETGVSEGWTEDDGTSTFRGMQSVARQDMAAFLHRMVEKGILG